MRTAARLALLAVAAATGSLLARYGAAEGVAGTPLAPDLASRGARLLLPVIVVATVLASRAAAPA